MIKQNTPFDIVTALLLLLSNVCTFHKTIFYCIPVLPDTDAGIVGLCLTHAVFIVLSDIDAGIVGLCLTYAVLLTGQFQWCVRQSAEVENQVWLFVLRM